MEKNHTRYLKVKGERPLWNCLLEMPVGQNSGDSPQVRKWPYLGGQKVNIHQTEYHRDVYSVSATIGSIQAIALDIDKCCHC